MNNHSLNTRRIVTITSVNSQGDTIVRNVNRDLREYVSQVRACWHDGRSNSRVRHLRETRTPRFGFIFDVT